MEKAAESIPQGIFGSNTSKQQLVCAKLISLSEEAVQTIERTVLITSDENKVDVDLTCTSEQDKGETVAPTWKKYGCYNLTTVDKSHLCTDHLLNDVHMGAAQELIKLQFPHIRGLHNTLMQNSKSMKAFDGDENLQIVHVQLGKIDHWVIISTRGCGSGEVELYDSLQQRPSLTTQKVIARYLRSPLQSIKIKLINVALQKGSADCGLYAIAMMTSIANNEEPANVVYDQTALRIHLKESFEKGFLGTFPVLRKRRVNNRIMMEVSCSIYCSCRLPDDGSKMIQCDSCNEWFHKDCLENLHVEVESIEESEQWLCKICDKT